MDNCCYTKTINENKIINNINICTDINDYNEKYLHKNYNTVRKKINYTEKKNNEEINNNSELILKSDNYKQKSQTYYKDHNIMKKKIFLFKLKEKSNNIENKEKIIKGLKILIGFFDKQKLNEPEIKKKDSNIIPIPPIKNIVIEKIKNNYINSRNNKKGNNIYNYDKVYYKDSLMSENHIKHLKIYSYEYILSLKNNIYSLKDNLLSEKTLRHCLDLSQQTNSNLVSNNDLETNENDFILEINKKQPENIFKFEITNLLNALTKKSFDDIFSKISSLLLSNKLNNDLFIENQKTLLEIIFIKASKEYCYGFLYAELCYELNIKLLKEFNDIKNNKELNLEYLINEESNNIFNKFKNMKINDLILNKNMFLGYINFISELIKIELLKQQFIFYIFDQIYQKFIENETEFIYLEGCIELINDTGKIINEKENNDKYINNLNIYLNDTFTNLLSNKKSLPNNIKYKIINLLEKSKNGWNKSLYEYSKSFNTIFKIPFLFYNDSKDSNISRNNNYEILTENSKSHDKIYVKNIIETDLLNYIKYSNDNNENQVSYNWTVIDKLINVKNIHFYKIIICYIKVCKNIINDEKNISYINDYIKNIIEFYTTNLSKKNINLTRKEIIKFLKNINEILDDDEKMFRIMGNLLFILVENGLFLIKDFNNFLAEDKKTINNLILIAKYCIISSGKYAKKYYNSFKQNKFFMNNIELFKKNTNEYLDDLFYYVE